MVMLMKISFLCLQIVDDDNIYTCFYSIIKGKKKIPEHRGPYAEFKISLYTF